MKKALLFCGFIVCYVTTFAQKKDSIKIINSLSPSATHQSITNITPPNPDAAALGKYGDTPVSLYIGTPNINIPLFQINRAVSIPIDLSYHASGVRVDEIPSMVGLNWVLNVGGVITCTVHGTPDNLTGGLQTTDGRTKFNQYRQNLMNATDRQTYEIGVMNGAYDTEPDEYFYNFLGRAGKLVFDASGNIFLLNHKKLVVTKNTAGFTITDEVGTKYYFTEKETTKPTTYCFDKNINYTAESAWYISSIQPLNGRSINFTYFSRDNITYTQGVNQTNRYFITADQNCTDDIQTPCKSVYRASVKQIQQISFDLGTVDFTYESRADLGFGWYRLKAFEVRNLSNLLIKKFSFVYAYNSVPLGTQPDRYILQEVNDVTDSNIPAISHKMEYYHFDDLPPRNANAQDHWGFYNNNTASTLIPQIPLSRVGFTWADREPDAEKSKYGMLTKITYPTGGSTIFGYESHDFGYLKTIEGNNLAETTGGVRIKTITNIDGTNPNQIHKYEYRMGDNTLRSSGCLLAKPVYYYDYSETKYIGNNDGYITANCSFLVASSSSQAYLGSTQGSHVGYEEVTEYLEEGTALNGKTTHKFSSYRDFPDYGNTDIFPFPSATSYDEARGQLKQKKVYRYDNGNFIVVQKNENIYGFTELSEVLGMKMMKSFMEYYVNGGMLYHTVVTEDFAYKKLWTPLLETHEYSYDDNGNNELHNQEINQYSSLHLQLKESQKQRSVSNQIDIERYTYPLDYSVPSGVVDAPTQAIKDMQDKNVVQKIIETQSIVKENGVEKLQNASLNTYNSSTATLKEVYSFVSPTGETTWTNSNIQGGNFQKDSHYEQDVSFDLYDTYGNLQQLTPKSGVVESYVWGYDSKLPILKVIGVPYSTLITYNPNVSLLTSDNDISNFGQLIRTISTQVQTFIHQPLQGLKYHFDPSGIQTSFVFDDSNRLKLINDHEANITDKFGYFYSSGVPSTCTTPPPPTVSISNTTLCDVTLSASSCTGTVTWSNGSVNNNITISSKTTQTFTATCADGSCISSASNSLTIPILPSGWTSGDIGSAAGCTQNSSGVLTLQGSGSVGGTDDIFHWIYKSMSGDFTMIAKINNLPAVNGQRSGIMIRSNTDSNAQFYTLIQDGNANVGQLKRDSNGGTGGLYSYAPSAVNQTWIKIVKTGTSIKAYHSTDSNPEVNNQWDENFNLTGTSPTTLDFGTNYLIGLVTYGTVNQTTFTNITINGNAF
jgi:hypothetical protein